MTGFKSKRQMAQERTSVTKEVLKLALEALEEAQTNNDGPEYWDRNKNAITALKQALAQPVQEPVAHTVIAGALFDFIGYLTSRKERVVLSASDDAAPAVDAIRDFAAKRGLSLDDAQVREWIEALAQPEERNFCQRCGKRTADLTAVHTCTPPQENT